MCANNIITKVEIGSIAEEMGLESGDLLISINGSPVKDVFDYRYMINEEYLELQIQKGNGEEWELEIEKYENEDLGLVFETGLMDKAKSCTNKCIFCFIDQMPKGLRDTLYFKDDDSRLSFLQGNYVTLTNVTDEELDRIIFYHLSPINISVHSTDSELRTFILNNPNAARITENIEKLYNARIEMNFQVVLCKNINDKEKLESTISDLAKFMPFARSLSVVPVGITKYREDLFELQPFTKQDSLEIIKLIEKYQRKFKKANGMAFVYAADEFYIKADISIPDYAKYENFPQIENGVGMLALFKREFEKALSKIKKVKCSKIAVITGVAAYQFIKLLLEDTSKIWPELKATAIVVENTFLGSEITVSGLLTGIDIINTLKSQDETYESILIPANALRVNDTVFLDGMDIKKLEKELGVNVKAVTISGHDLVTAITETFN